MLTRNQQLDQQHLQGLGRQLVKQCPDMRQMARDVAIRILQRHDQGHLDPDNVYLHRFKGARSDPRAFSGWVHHEMPYRSLTLPQLVMQRFDVNDQDNDDLLSYRTGFYSDGPEHLSFDASNEVRLAPRDILADLWHVDFSADFHQQVAQFWTRHADNFRTLAKANFLAKVVWACENEHDDAKVNRYREVALALTGIQGWPPSLTQLQQQADPVAGIRVCTFDIGGHVATDILRVELADGCQVLYTPGAVEALHTFASNDELYWWVLHNTRSTEDRARFMAHFAQSSHAEKKDDVGLNHMIDLLFYNWGSNRHSALNQVNATITIDAFTHLRNAARQRMIDDSDFSLRSNADLRKLLWIGYLRTFGQFASAMAAVDWPVALAAVGAGLAETGLNIDQAINGHTTAERRAGVIGAVIASINTLFNAATLAGTATVVDELGEVTETNTGQPPAPPAPSPVDLAEALPATREELKAWVPAPYRTSNPSRLLTPFETNVLLAGEPGSGKFQGIYTHKGDYYAQVENLPYRVRYVGELSTWVVVDPQNPYSFYRNVPIRLNEHGDWEALESGLKGGAPRFRLKLWGRPAPTPALPELELPSYEAPKAMREALKSAAIGQKTSHLSGDLFDPSNPRLEQAYAEYRNLRDRLAADAQDFFEGAKLPQRPQIPLLEIDATPNQIITRLYEHSNGLVIGESHSALGSKRFLIDNMQQFKKQQVRVLYVEHFMTDFQQADLDVFNRTGQMPQDLKAYVISQDEGHGTDPAQRYTFMQVLVAAQRHGIRIQAIDCMASYRQAWSLKPEGAIRQQMMNFFAHRVIEADQTLRGTSKWVALVGNTHANTYENVAGISELEGAIGLRVEDIQAGLADRIDVDPGFSTVETGFKARRIQSDLRLQVGIKQPQRMRRPLEQRLATPGSFCFTDVEGQLNLVHRSKDLTLQYTPIQHEGRYLFINRTQWSWIDKRRMAGVGELVTLLISNGLTYIPV